MQANNVNSHLQFAHRARPANARFGLVPWRSNSTPVDNAKGNKLRCLGSVNVLSANLNTALLTISTYRRKLVALRLFDARFLWKECPLMKQRMAPTSCTANFVPRKITRTDSRSRTQWAS